MTAATEARRIERLLRAPAAVGGPGVPALPTVADWRAFWRGGCVQGETAFETAVQGGFAADRVGWALTAGCQAALQGLLRAQGLPFDGQELLAFCLTEATGNRPRDLHCAAVLQGDARWQLDGAKHWTTLGSACDAYLVMAVASEAAARPPDQAVDSPTLDLRLFRVPADAPGLSLQPMPPTRFVPEVPHTRMRLDGVRLAADAALRGEGWSTYGKAFRTWEDTLVATAVLSHLLRESRARAWPTAFTEQVVAVLQTLRSVAEQAALDANGAATHVLLGGALTLTHALYDAATGWYAQADAGDEAAVRWARDAELFQVAGKARSARSARAWQRLAT